MRHYALLAGLVLLWLAMLLAGGSDADRSLLVDAYAGERPWAAPALLITRLGDWEMLLAITFLACAWLLRHGRKRLALFVLGWTLLGRLFVAVQKATLGRLRPEENPHLVDVQSLSFPSGHAANAMAAYLLLAILLTRPGRARGWAVGAALLLALLIGASRVLLGVHWPSDVMGGWAFGAIWALIGVSLAERLQAPRQERAPAADEA